MSKVHITVMENKIITITEREGKSKQHVFQRECTTVRKLHQYEDTMRTMKMLLCTLRLILSTCRFWFSNSEPMSMAMLRRFPIIVFTCPMFSSISSSRASLVILDLNILISVHINYFLGIAFCLKYIYFVFLYCKHNK